MRAMVYIRVATEGQLRRGSMLEGEIKVGDRLIWEHRDPRAFARVEVVHVSERIDGEAWIEMLDGRGRRTCNVESRVREACVRYES